MITLTIANHLPLDLNARAFVLDARDAAAYGTSAFPAHYTRRPDHNIDRAASLQLVTDPS